MASIRRIECDRETLYVFPKEHLESLLEASGELQLEAWTLVKRAKAQLQVEAPHRNVRIELHDHPTAALQVSHAYIKLSELLSDEPHSSDTEYPSEVVQNPIPRPPERRARLSTGGHEDPFSRHLLPLISWADRISIISAFVQESGVILLDDVFRSALERGTSIRLLTGDYLNITQKSALQRLLEWSTYIDERFRHSADAKLGTFEARILEVARLKPGQSFHPKAWRFEHGDLGVAFVGSSNISRTALAHGIEWNLRIHRHHDAVTWKHLQTGFEELWERATPLSDAWIASYQERVREQQTSEVLSALRDEAEKIETPEPRPVQQEALERLTRMRTDGSTRALVVFATGLGKTWLAAFDVQQFKQQEPSARILFIAHRVELLQQAAKTFRRLWPSVELGWSVGERHTLQGEVILASVQKLSRADVLDSLSPHTFDYIILDEVHHAAAPSYRRILRHLQPKFLLGLTATPDRADASDIRALFHDQVALEVGLGEAIERGFLCPFDYLGLKDTADYAQIPWRNNRFDAQALAKAVETQARMVTLWEAWQKTPGRRTLVFCCSISHAQFVGDWLAAKGLRVAVVYAGPGSADRAASISALESGALEVLCSVDIFNEGVDLPALDRVVMLRPTESSVVFLQQLGRGLRLSPEKKQLQVIDFIGNHDLFLQRLRHLLMLYRTPRSMKELLQQLKTGEPLALPKGCRVKVELEAIDLLSTRLPRASRGGLMQVYREQRTMTGQRPTAGELRRLGFLPSDAVGPGESWFSFVQSEGDLDEAQEHVFESCSAFLIWVQQLSVSRRLPLLVLIQSLMECLGYRPGYPEEALRAAFDDQLRREPLLRTGVALQLVEENEADEPSEETPSGLWSKLWRRLQTQPAQWLGTLWTLREEVLTLRLPELISIEHMEALELLTLELLDWKLWQARRRQQDLSGGAGFMAEVSFSGNDPMLKLPARSRHALPAPGRLEARLETGELIQFELGASEIIRAQRPGYTANILPDLLHRLFGPRAGASASRTHLRFYRSPDGWWIEPLEMMYDLTQQREEVISYPSLKAAAGASDVAIYESPEASRVRLPVRRNSTALFAVRVTGSSMNGGSNPLREGDWALMEWSRAAAGPALRDQVVLVAEGDPQEGQHYHIKRLVKTDGAYLLASDNPSVEPMKVTPHTTVLAILKEHISPSNLAPPVGTYLSHDAILETFALTERPRAPFRRVDGHLFILLEQGTPLETPKVLNLPIPKRGPGETAFVLAWLAQRQCWRYCGVAYPFEGMWTLDEVDFETWKQFGMGKEVSRILEPEWRTQAQTFVVQKVRVSAPTEWLEEGERCFQIVERSSGGGVLIRTPEMRKPRSISLTDLGWVLKAAHARSPGTVLTEAEVNRLRYLEGTPQKSTRWIDTGWAIRIVSAFAQR